MSNTHDPVEAALAVAAKLSARSRHVCLFIGAGASKAAGLPDLKGLESKVVAALDGDTKKKVKELFEKRNLENSLSYLRRLTTVLDDGESIGEFNKANAESTQKAITQAIIPELDHEKADKTAFRYLANWVSGDYYTNPIELFTINYDLLVESALESAAVPYFDGFIGNIHARFHPELVDSADFNQPLPRNFVRLWKLHGSVSWEENEVEGVKRIVRVGGPARASGVAAIYPSDEKYDQSRRVPFTVLMDRFRRALAMPETVTVISGYSFGDQHLNEMIFDAAKARPRSETIIFSFDSIPHNVEEVAVSTRNLTVYSKKQAIIAGQKAQWSKQESAPGVWEDESFLLHDFTFLMRFLATKSKSGEDHE